MKRGRSVLGSVLDQKRSLLAEHLQERDYADTLQELKRSPQRLQQFINSYRLASTAEDQQQIYTQFRKQQMNYKRSREYLTAQFNTLQKQQASNPQQFNYVKSELVRSIKKQMNLDLEMNQLIDQRRKQRDRQQLRWANLEGKTPRVQNALNDIIQKTEQIKQLQAAIKECLNLLEIIGVLVKQQGDKIQVVQDQVKEANFFIQQAQAQIDIAKKKKERSTRKKCCVIIIGLVAILLILIVLFGLSIVQI